MIIVVADRHRAQVYRCESETLSRVETIRWYVAAGHPLRGAPSWHLGLPLTTHAPSHHTARREFGKGCDHPLTDAVDRVLACGADDQTIVVCGTHGVADRLSDLLAIAEPHKVVRVAGVDARASEADLLRAARACVTSERSIVRTDRTRPRRTVRPPATQSRQIARTA